MASYSIILNLAGNAQERMSKLSRTIQGANTQAKSLHKTLVAIGVASRLIDMRGFRIPSGGGGGGSANPLYRRERDVNYTRHRATRIASWGTGFSIGGFTGRLSTIIQPDINGKIFGMDAARLMKGVNIAGIATNVMTSIGKALLKTTAFTTIGTYAVGAGVNRLFTNLLMSEGMAQGVRIIQRRNQARLGLGASFLRAQEYADALARDYGLERSASISSLNVLAGLKVGTTGNKLSLQHAAALTRVGGLISQQSGAPFERVMTNIQQLLTQSNPNVRDIRELLNAAPILGRYALDEMEKKGITGVDKNTYLKDQRNILSVLQRYDVENTSSTVMQARGMVTMAQQDFYAKLAENPNWLSVAGATADLMSSLATAVSNLLSAFTQNTNFQNSINSLTFLVQTIGENATGIIDWTSNAGKWLADLFGLDIAETQAKARKYTQQRETIAHYGAAFSDDVFTQWLRAGGSTSNDPDIQRKQFDTWWAKEIETASRLGSPLLNAVQWGAIPDRSDTEAAWRHNINIATSIPDVSLSPYIYYPKGTKGFANQYKPFIGREPANRVPASKSNFYAISSSIEPSAWSAFVKERIGELTKSATLGAFGGSAGTAPAGSDLTGFNRDRRSLEIHFHDAIVEWNSTINTDNPQEVVNEVSETIEGAASRAIQIALLGASQKMNTRWY